MVVKLSRQCRCVSRCRGGIGVVVVVSAVISVEVVAVSLVVAGIDVLGLAEVIGDTYLGIVVVVEVVDVVVVVDLALMLRRSYCLRYWAVRGSHVIVIADVSLDVVVALRS